MPAEIVGTEVTTLEPPEKKKPVGVWVKGSGVKYDPDKEAFKDFEVGTDDYVKRFAGRKYFKVGKRGHKESFEPSVDALLQTPVVFREGGKFYFRWKPTRVVGSMSDAEEYFNSGQGQAKRALESFGDPFDLGSGGGAGGSQFFSNTPVSPTALIDSNEFVPFLNGPFYKQLYQYDYLFMHARAFQLVNHAALAAGAVKIMTRFVLGRGISFSVKDEKAQKVWNSFWEDNGMRDKVRQMARDLSWQGELMLRFYERQPGRLTMRIIDPSTCWEVVTDPEDFEHCLDGATKIALLDGTNPTVEELAIRGVSEDKPVWVYCWDKNAWRIVPGKVTKCWEQPKKKRCVEVTLDSGESVVMSFDHPVLLRSGEYRWAESLRPGDSLMPLYRRRNKDGYEELMQPHEAVYNHKVVSVKLAGDRVVYDLQVEKHHNFALTCGIFTHNTYYYHFQWPCLRGDVRISCLDGTESTIKELAERQAQDGKPVWVYSYDSESGQVVPGKATKIWKTGRKRCVEVEIDSGEKVVCSWDHPFLLRDGRYLKAEDLRPGDSLMPLYRRRDYEWVWHPGTAKWQRTHNMVAAHEQGLKPEGYVDHHLNSNPTDNRPDNLARMPKVVHDGETCRGRWKNPDLQEWVDGFKKKMSVVSKKAWERGAYAALVGKGSRAPRPEWRGKIAEGVKNSWANPEIRARRIANMRGPRKKAPENHKVVVIRPLGEFVVYDMQVEKYHNFALACGVFTHNTPYQIWTQGNIPVQKYIIQQVPPTNVQHIKINISSQEKRGRSDLLPAMPWLKRFDDYFNGAVMKAVLEANLVYKVKVHGDQSDTDAIQNDPAFTIMPPPGGTWLENDAVDMTPLSAVMSGGGGRGGLSIGQHIASIVATSLNLPTEYFNIEGGAGGARATALVRTDPAVKAVEDRQQILRESLEDTYDRVMEAAIREGILDVSSARKEPMVVPDEQQQDDEHDQDRDLPFAGSAHAAKVTPSTVKTSLPGRPVRAQVRG